MVKKGKLVEEIRDYDDSRANNPNKQKNDVGLTAFLNMIKDGGDKDISSSRICFRLLCLFDAFCLALQLFTLLIFLYAFCGCVLER